MSNLVRPITLAGGSVIPQLGFGVYRSPASVTVASVTSALAAGYRHIDSAQMYRNEAEVGQAIRASKIPREDVFITTKLFTDEGDVYALCEDSVSKINLGGYVDLMLVHSPHGGLEGRKKKWAALEKLKQAGKVKAIGVSNYGVRHLEEMKTYAKEPIAVNQIELHPFHQQKPIVEYCIANNIVLEAYCPIVRGQKVDDPTLVEVAKETGKNTTQILIKWSLQKGYIPLPKSDTPSRIASNADVFGFELTTEQMAKLDALDVQEAISWDPTDVE